MTTMIRMSRLGAFRSSDAILPRSGWRRRGPRAPVDVAELLADLPNGGRVDDRGHLLQMVNQEAVEERLVAVLQSGEEEIALHVVPGALIVLVGAGALLFFRRDAGREEAAEPEGFALLDAEASSLVEKWIVLQRFAAREHGSVPLSRRGIDPLLEPHHVGQYRGNRTTYGTMPSYYQSSP